LRSRAGAAASAGALDRNLHPVRPTRRDLLCAGRLDRPDAHLLFRAHGGVAFWALLLAAFSYALLRGIAESLIRRMADPSLYAARVREAWHAARELPRFRIVRRVDLLAQLLYLALTVLCIFYLIVITIDWYDGVIRLSDTFFRQIAIDGRYRDFPIWSFVIPSIVLMAWKLITVLRKEKVRAATSAL
jgi:hypothetical protein